MRKLDASTAEKFVVATSALMQFKALPPRDDRRMTLDVWSQGLMVQQPRMSGRKRYGPGSTRERHDDRGRPSSDTA